LFCPSDLFEEKRDFLLLKNILQATPPRKKGYKKPNFRIAPLFPNGDTVAI
jgi:hypothetical protein